MTKEEFAQFKEENLELVRKYQAVCSEITLKNTANRSKRILYKTLISTASKFKDEEALYFCYGEVEYIAFKVGTALTHKVWG